MTIRLSSGITPNYVARATGFLESVKRHCWNVRPLIFAPNFPDATRQVLDVPCVAFDYARCALNLPKFMVQNGAFTAFAPADWDEDDVIIFTDADACFQRPFSPEELDLFASVPPGTMLADYNCPNHHQTLLSEAHDLFPKRPMAEIERDFPGMEKIECLNWGFVVATLATWRELHRRTVALWPACDASFGNPARVQLVSVYGASQPGMSVRRLPAAIHAHGHHGIKHGLEKGRDGLWRQHGAVVAFAHAL